MFSYFTYDYWFSTKVEELNPNQITKLMSLPLKERQKPHPIDSDPLLTELKQRLSENQFGLRFTGLLEFD